MVGILIGLLKAGGVTIGESLTIGESRTIGEHLTIYMYRYARQLLLSAWPSCIQLAN